MKVLRPELAAVLGADRFVQEIEITANLQHPNILPLFDSGESDSFLYYVMPYVEGESLRDRLNGEGQLAIGDALGITKAVAGALDYAHKRGVIHRDIKPENILLQDGVVLMADFGIALALKTAGGERLTETGLSIGTPAYMSPEQVAGERKLDARSDVYALACVTYEMLAGDPPFVASSAQAVMAKHVTDPAPPITTTRPSVGPAVAAALARALSKVPADRHDTAGFFARALVKGPETAQPITKSIVVLPFSNLSPDADNEYFSDGLTEELITELARIKLLRVISRNSAIKLKGTDKDSKTIGRELDIEYILLGTVRRAGERLRITAQLVEARNDTQVWADRYDGTLEDVFDMQEQVSRSIVDALELQLTPEEERHIASRPIDNVQAYEYYIRARQEVWQFTENAFERAVKYLERGLEIIGPNSMLLAGMGYVYMQYVNIGLAQQLYIDRADEYARKALDLDPESPEGHLVLAFTAAVFHAEPIRAFSHFRRALAVNPDDAHALFWFIVVHTIVGRIAEAKPLARHLISVDPLTPMNRFILGYLAFMEGRTEQGVEVCQEWHRSDPQNPMACFWYGIFLAHAQRFDDVQALVQNGFSTSAEDALSKMMLFLDAAIRADHDAMEQLANADVIATWRRDPEFSWLVASTYALAGNRDKAVEWLANTIDRGYINYPMLADIDPFLRRLRGDPRFERIIEQVRREWTAFDSESSSELEIVYHSNAHPNDE